MKTVAINTEAIRSQTEKMSLAYHHLDDRSVKRKHTERTITDGTTVNMFDGLQHAEKNNYEPKDEVFRRRLFRRVLATEELRFRTKRTDTSWITKNSTLL